MDREYIGSISVPRPMSSSGREQADDDDDRVWTSRDCYYPFSPAPRVFGTGMSRLIDEVLFVRLFCQTSIITSMLLKLKMIFPGWPKGKKRQRSCIHIMLREKYVDWFELWTKKMG